MRNLSLAASLRLRKINARTLFDTLPQGGFAAERDAVNNILADMPGMGCGGPRQIPNKFSVNPTRLLLKVFDSNSCQT